MKKIILIYLLISVVSLSFAQQKKVEDPVLAIYKLLSNESVKLKDSLAIYALNFELSITKIPGGTIVKNITANDSLAFILFPSYKKLADINFKSLMGGRNNISLVIPILIYGSSPEKQLNKDKDGKPLISLYAAVNAAYSLYNTAKYSNIKDGQETLGHLLFRNAKKNNNFLEKVIIEPFTIEILNIK